MSKMVTMTEEELERIRTQARDSGYQAGASDVFWENVISGARHQMEERGREERQRWIDDLYRSGRNLNLV